LNQGESAKRLGAAVARRRKALRITQRDLADLSECSEPFIVQLESGKPTVRLDKVLDVLRTLGLELWLTSGKGGIVVDPEF
jgi:y4mF family transcriptional regulator